MAKPELRDHRKFLKLRRLLGEPTPHVIGYLECLWIRGYQTGSAFIGDCTDVEAAAEYPGESGKLAAALFESGFLDRDADGTFCIHDLYEHAPRYVRRRMERIGTAPEGDQWAPTDHQDSPNGRPLGAPVAAETRSADTITQTQTQTQTENPNPNPNLKDKRQRQGAFSPPTVAEVSEYVATRRTKIDPEAFVDFYASKGWKIGSNPMRDWQACVRTWEKRARERSPPTANGRRPSREDELLAELRHAEGAP